MIFQARWLATAVGSCGSEDVVAEIRFWVLDTGPKSRGAASFTVDGPHSPSCALRLLEHIYSTFCSISLPTSTWLNPLCADSLPQVWRKRPLRVSDSNAGFRLIRRWGASRPHEMQVPCRALQGWLKLVQVSTMACQR